MTRHLPAALAAAMLALGACAPQQSGSPAPRLDNVYVAAGATLTVNAGGTGSGGQTRGGNTVSPETQAGLNTGKGSLALPSLVPGGALLDAPLDPAR